VEFKFCKTKTPNLDVLLKPSQKAGLIEYYEAGGRKRFVLVCNMAGVCFLYNTVTVYTSLKGVRGVATSVADLEDAKFPARLWLPQMLELL
jgi:hypothetical protein